MCGYSVRIPKGNYTVKVSVDTGPLAGVLTGSKDVVFRRASVLTDWTEVNRRLVVSLGCVVLLVSGLVFARVRRRKREVKFR